jgi:hypothetical protein
VKEDRAERKRCKGKGREVIPLSPADKEINLRPDRLICRRGLRKGLDFIDIY